MYISFIHNSLSNKLSSSEFTDRFSENLVLILCNNTNGQTKKTIAPITKKAKISPKPHKKPLQSNEGKTIITQRINRINPQLKRLRKKKLVPLDPPDL